MKHKIRESKKKRKNQDLKLNIIIMYDDTYTISNLDRLVHCSVREYGKAVWAVQTVL